MNKYRYAGYFLVALFFTNQCIKAETILKFGQKESTSKVYILGSSHYGYNLQALPNFPTFFNHLPIDIIFSESPKDNFVEKYKNYRPENKMVRRIRHDVSELIAGYMKKPIQNLTDADYISFGYQAYKDLEQKGKTNEQLYKALYGQESWVHVCSAVEKYMLGWNCQTDKIHINIMEPLLLSIYVSNAIRADYEKTAGKPTYLEDASLDYEIMNLAGDFIDQFDYLDKETHLNVYPEITVEALYGTINQITTKSKKDFVNTMYQNMFDYKNLVIKGDLKQQESFCLKEGYSTKINQVMLDERNKRWIQYIQQSYDTLHENRDIFVVVGLCHQFGKQGLIELLKNKGFVREEDIKLSAD